MSARPLKVLFLTRYPRAGASSRYRVYQYLPHLEALGVHCETQSFMDDEMYSCFFAPGAGLRKAWLVLKASVRRLRVLARFRDYDILYLQRELLPFAPPWCERYLKRRGAVLLFDYDDALFINKPSRFNPIATLLRSPGKTLEMFRLADCVVAGNDWLRDTASAHGARAVTLEVAEDTGRIPMHAPHTNERPVTIGWLGSTSTVKYLRLIEPVLRRIAGEYPAVRFELMGGGDFQMQGVPWVMSTWTLAAELEALSRFDIGLMPLPDEEWARGKSGGKARTYMAAGVVPVCAAIGYNCELVDHARTGYLCCEESDWYTAITSLIGDAGLRQRLAAQAREEVVTRFSPARQAARMRQLFDEVSGAASGPVTGGGARRQ
ncbi:MAG: glycosyltransferase family 4 protein [Halioglobus sp.]|nr:glycosyltransferase family 4 protein [Halioglobus sp.]